MIPVVIGAAYGDEGKGQTVHALASRRSIVVRFNGSSQAGHTVRCEGRRRVFSHVGAGTYKGAATHLSRFFVCNPLAFLEEWYSLACEGITPEVTISPESPVLTIFDTAINRALEEQRGTDRHGSVGIGFGEAVERSQWPEFSLTIRDFQSAQTLGWSRVKAKLWAIRDRWISRRCTYLGVDMGRIPHHFLFDEGVIQRLVDDFQVFLDCVKVQDDFWLLDQRERLLFEGAQGLMLDQNNGTFPYVTRSNTGLTNVRELLGGEPLDVYYVTRAYTTRHGAGPLPFELPEKPYPGIQDETNIPHRFQGALRFSYLNLDTLKEAVRLDARQLPTGSRAHAVVTCLDQLPSRATVIENGQPRFQETRFLPRAVERVTGCQAKEFPQWQSI